QLSFNPTDTLFLFFFHTSAHHPNLHSFPTRRSSDLDAKLIDMEKKGGFGGGMGKKGGGGGFGFQARRLASPGDYRVWIYVEGERSEEHTSELQSRENLVCRLLLEKKKYKK